MPDYRKMYFALAAKVADAIDILVAAQQAGEEAAVEADAVLLVFGQEDANKREM